MVPDQDAERFRTVGGVIDYIENPRNHLTKFVAAGQRTWRIASHILPLAVMSLSSRRTRLRGGANTLLAQAISHTRDTIGPMARTIADLVLLDSVITGDGRHAPTLAPRRIRLGVVPEMFLNIDAETLQLVNQALDKLGRAGIEILQLQATGFLDLDNQSGFPIALFEATRDIAAYLSAYHTGLTLTQLVAQIASPDVKFAFDNSVVPGAPNAIPQSVYDNAVNVVRPRLQKLYADTFENNDLDAIVFPMTPLPASPIIGSDSTVVLNGVQVPTFQTYIRNADPGSVAGVPGISLPVALTRGGLPVGLGIDGPAGSDRDLLAVALALERILGQLPAPAGF